MEKLLAVAILGIAGAYCLAGFLGMLLPWDGSIW